jgi:hypothetical protein
MAAAGRLACRCWRWWGRAGSARCPQPHPARRRQRGGACGARWPRLVRGVRAAGLGTGRRAGTRARAGHRRPTPRSRPGTSHRPGPHKRPPRGRKRAGDGAPCAGEGRAPLPGRPAVRGVHRARPVRRQRVRPDRLGWAKMSRQARTSVVVIRDSTPHDHRKPYLPSHQPQTSPNYTPKPHHPGHID